MKQKQNETKHLLSTEANRNRLLEDAAERLYPDCSNVLRQMAKETFIKGAKWQQEQRYSEEEVIKILYQFHYDLVNSNFDTKEEWFEQFKKK